MSRAASAWVLAAAALVAVPAARPAAAAPVPADDAAKDAVAAATALRDEAKALFKVAGDPDAEPAERSKARKDCWKKLKEARRLLDAHVAAHPDQANALDALSCDLGSMLFWLKKELTLEEMRELTGGAPPHRPGGRSDPAPGGGKPGGDGGASGPGGAAPPNAASEPPPAPKGPTPADGLAEVAAYAAEHPGDVPGLHERYSDFLERFPDPSTPEYAQAAAALKGLEERMKDVYRAARDDDPDSVRSEDPAETQRRLRQLLEDLASGDDAVRARAARLLGYLGSPEAVPPLLEALRGAPPGPLREASAQALADLAGRRVYDRLVKAAQKDSTLNGPVVEVLRRGLAKGGPAGRLAGETLARFAESISLETCVAAIAALKEAGAAGAPGLAYATATYAPDEDRLALIEHVGAFNDPRTVGWLARFCVVGASGRRIDQAVAARQVIEKIGRPGVRHLIPALDEPSVALRVAELLKSITGAKLKDDRRKTWESWFRKNRKQFE